jgi:hypothetical protein
MGEENLTKYILHDAAMRINIHQSKKFQKDMGR